MAKILLVEDDSNLREIYSASLTAEGYEIVTASNGEEALAQAMQQKPNLIVLDVMMPKISGFDVLDIIRSTPEIKDTKIIMMTALGQQSDKERGAQLGVDLYLVKSQITIEEMVASVAQVLTDKANLPPSQESQNQPINPESALANQTDQLASQMTTEQPAQIPPAINPETPPVADPSSQQVPVPANEVPVVADQLQSVEQNIPADNFIPPVEAENIDNTQNPAN